MRKWLVSHNTRVLALAATAVALTLLALPGCRSGGTAAATERTEGPLAVVLVPTSSFTKLVVVDLARFRVVRTIPLRSLVTDIDVDDPTGLVVAAQTGGIGERADNAVSLVDPRDGRVRYVTLDVRDPVNVACFDGSAYVLHSVVTSQGLVCSVVDLKRAALLRTGRVPDGPGVWCRSGDELWSVIEQAGAWQAARISTSTLKPAGRFAAGMRVEGVAPSESGSVLLGESVRPLTGAVAALVTTHTTAVPVGLPGLRYPARIAAQTGGLLVIGDWAGQDPEPRSLAVVDAVTLKSVRTVTVDGVPCALAAWNDTALVVERTTGRLLELDPATGAIGRSVPLGSSDLLVSDVVVLPR